MLVLEWFKKILKDFSWREFGYMIAIVALLISKSCQPTIPIQVIQPPYRPTEQKTDKKGTEYIQVSGNLYTPEQMKHIVDSIAKALGTKPGNISGVTGTTTTIDTHAHTTKTIYIDTFRHTIADSVFTKQYFLCYHGNFATRTGDFHMQLSPDTATYVSIVTKRLFKSDELNVKIYHTNELFIPQTGYSYATKIPKTLAVVGPFLGLGYNGKVIPVVGVGITFNLISIKSKH